jgi:hypothetical protein
MNESMTTTLKKLRLSGLAETLEVRLYEAQSNQLTHAEFLELLLQDEMLVRGERRIARRLKSAAFRDLKSLEDFDWSFNRNIKQKEIFELATGRFVREGSDVLLYGPPGTGPGLQSPLAHRLGFCPSLPAVCSMSSSCSAFRNDASRFQIGTRHSVSVAASSRSRR